MAREQEPTQVFMAGDRRVAGGTAPAGDAVLDLAERDLVRDMNGCLKARAAGLLHVVGGSRGAEAGAKYRLAGQIEVATVLEDGAGGELAQLGALQAEPGDQPIHRRRQHGLV